MIIYAVEISYCEKRYFKKYEDAAKVAIEYEFDAPQTSNEILKDYQETWGDNYTIKFEYVDGIQDSNDEYYVSGGYTTDDCIKTIYLLAKDNAYNYVDIEEIEVE